MPDDPEEGDDGVGADVAVKVEITVDPTGKTIHTQASDIQVGDPVEVRDTANGGPVEVALGGVGRIGSGGGGVGLEGIDGPRRPRR